MVVGQTILTAAYVVSDKAVYRQGVITDWITPGIGAQKQGVTCRVKGKLQKCVQEDSVKERLT